MNGEVNKRYLDSVTLCLCVIVQTLYEACVRHGDVSWFIVVVWSFFYRDGFVEAWILHWRFPPGEFWHFHRVNDGHILKKSIGPSCLRNSIIKVLSIK